MKTRHFLTALALPALMAACTADEFENMDFNNAQGQRPLLSENFVLKLADDASTRYAVTGDDKLDFGWEQGDLIGAAIIDNYEANKDPEQWEMPGGLAGNNPFEYQADSKEWKAYTRLGIGHYLFTYKYNEADNGRSAMKYALPTVQELYQSEDGAVDLNAAIKKNNKSVAAALLKEDDASLTAKLRNVFTYPKFIINLDNGEKATTVSKVVLEYTGDGFGHNSGTNSKSGFLVKGGFHHENTYKLFENAEAATDEQEYWDGKTETSAFLREYKGNDDDGFTTFEYNPYLIAKFPKGTELKKDGADNKYIEVRFMMPGTKMTYGTNSFTGGIYKGALNMYIYTDNGVYEIKDVVNKIVFNKSTAKNLKERILVRNASYTLTLDKEAANKTDEELYIVTNTEDWNELVATYGGFTSYTESAPLKIAVAGDNFTLDASAKMPSKAFFQINTEVKVEGKVALSNIICEEIVTVEEGAELTTSATFSAETITNKGTLNIAVAKDADGDVIPYKGVESITNKGKLNIAKDAVAEFALTNEKGAVVENEGTITVKGSNEGEINNDGTMQTVNFENKVWEKKNDKYTNKPTINNNGEILSIGTLTNNAFIVNNGEMTCSAADGGKIENAATGFLDSVKDKITYITTNNGTVTVYEANPGSDVTINTQNGVVEYAAVNKTENFKNSIVTKVIAAQELTMSDRGKVTDVVMTKAGKLTLPKNATSLTNLTVEEGVVVLGSNLDVTETLTIAKGASITIPADYVMSAKAMANNGSILVAGTFKTEMKKGVEGTGTVKTEGADASVVWDSANPTVGQYKEALKTCLTNFINIDNYYYETVGGYKVEEANFNTYLAAGNDQGRQELKEKMAAAGVDKVSQADLNEAKEAVVKTNANKTAFMTAVKAGTWVAQATLYDTGNAANATANPPVTSAYALLADVVKGDNAKMVTGMSGDVTNVVYAYASYLTADEIKALIAEKNPTMFVWKDCDLDKLVALWAEYSEAITNDAVTGIEAKDYKEAKAGNVTGKAGMLVDWVKLVLNTTSGIPAVSQAQTALGTLSITATSIKKFAEYTDKQMNAVDSELVVND